jgi:ABC-type glutathione transport system ATPase component
VQRQLERLSCTRILIAHRLSTVVHADRILVMEDGALVEQGTHAELLARGGAYTRLVEAQLGDASSGERPVPQSANRRPPGKSSRAGASAGDQTGGKKSNGKKARSGAEVVPLRRPELAVAVGGAYRMYDPDAPTWTGEPWEDE